MNNITIQNKNNVSIPAHITTAISNRRNWEPGLIRFTVEPTADTIGYCKWQGSVPIGTGKLIGQFMVGNVSYSVQGHRW